MRAISNVEIAKRLLLDEIIASHFTFVEVLFVVDLCRGIDEELTPCDVREVVERFRYGFLERIYWREYEKGR